MNHKRRRNTKTKKERATLTHHHRCRPANPGKKDCLNNSPKKLVSPLEGYNKHGFQNETLEERRQTTKNNNKGCLYHTETLTARSLDLALIIFLVFAVGRPTSSSMKTLPYFSLGLATAVLLGTEKTTFLTLGTTTRLYICSMGRSSQ